MNPSNCICGKPPILVWQERPFRSNRFHVSCSDFGHQRTEWVDSPTVAYGQWNEKIADLEMRADAARRNAKLEEVKAVSAENRPFSCKIPCTTCGLSFTWIGGPVVCPLCVRDWSDNEARAKQASSDLVVLANQNTQLLAELRDSQERARVLRIGVRQQIEENATLVRALKSAEESRDQARAMYETAGQERDKYKTLWTEMGAVGAKQWPASELLEENRKLSEELGKARQMAEARRKDGINLANELGAAKRRSEIWEQSALNRQAALHALELERDNYRIRAQQLAEQLDAVKIERDQAEKTALAGDEIVKRLRAERDAAIQDRKNICRDMGELRQQTHAIETELREARAEIAHEVAEGIRLRKDLQDAAELRAELEHRLKGSEKGTLYQPFAYPFDVTIEAEFGRWMNANADGIFGSNQAVRLWHMAISGEVRGQVWTCIWLVLRHLHAIGPRRPDVSMPDVDRLIDRVLANYPGTANDWSELSARQSLYFRHLLRRCINFLPKLDGPVSDIPSVLGDSKDRNLNDGQSSHSSTSENAQPSIASGDAEQSSVSGSPS